MEINSSILTAPMEKIILTAPPEKMVNGVHLHTSGAVQMDQTLRESQNRRSSCSPWGECVTPQVEVQ